MEDIAEEKQPYIIKNNTDKNQYGYRQNREKGEINNQRKNKQDIRSKP